MYNETVLENTAIRAIFNHQYSTEKAIRFVCTELPGVPKEAASRMLSKVMLPFFGGKRSQYD